MILIRPYRGSDHDFICSSYLNSTYFNSIDKSTRQVKKHDHDLAMDRKINSLIGESVVLVACPEDDPELIVGYLIGVHNVLHYIYVKKDFRQMGVCNELLKYSNLPHDIFVTHLSKNSAHITSKFVEYTYNPYIFA